MKLFRDWQKRKPVNQILESAPENLSDDAKKFRENYRQLQENIRSLEAQRSELQNSMQAAENSSDVYSYNNAKNSAAEIDRQLETARTDLEKMMPPTSFKNISESEKLAAEITRRTHELNGLRAQIEDLGKPADKKSMRKLDSLKSQTASTDKKLLDAQERHDELNDVGKIWREGELDTSSTQEILSLLQAGMAQTQRKIDSVSRKTRKASDDPKSTATLANLENQLSELKSVMNAPVNPVLNVSQAMDEVSKARETLTSLATQLSATQNEYDKAVSAGNEVDAANFMRESEEIKNQAGNLLLFAQNLGMEVDAVILEHAPKMLTEVYGQRVAKQNPTTQEDTTQKIETPTQGLPPSDSINYDEQAESAEKEIQSNISRLNDEGENLNGLIERE